MTTKASTASTPKVYSYIRFSTPAQSLGTSRKRQTAEAVAYAEECGLPLDEELTDEGVSSHRGQNTAEGTALGIFLAAVNLGQVARGSVLLVENIDRLSRQSPRKTAGIINSIVDAGIKFVTLDPRREYTSESLDGDFMALFELMIHAQRAHDESVQKSRRGSKTWQGKQNDAARDPSLKLTSVCPPWLTLNSTRDGFIVHEERAEIVRRIFRDTLSGVGSHAITAALNAEGIPSFMVRLNAEGQPVYSANPATADKQRNGFWRRTYLAKLLKSASVIGTYTMQQGSYVAQTRVRSDRGEIANYYPPIVSEQDFLAVRAMRQTKNPRRGRHSSVAVRNLFGGIACCARCGGPMIRINKTKTSVYLVCEKAKAGAGCRYSAVRYSLAEAAFLDALPDLMQDAPLGEAAEQLTKDIASADAYLSVLSDQYEAAFRSMTRKRSPETAATLRRLEHERDSLNEQRKELELRRSVSGAPMIQHRVNELWDICMTEPLDLTKANATLRRLCSRVTIDPDAHTLTLTFIPSGESRPVVYDPSKASAYGFADEGSGFTASKPRKSRPKTK